MPSKAVSNAFNTKIGNPWNDLPVGTMETWPVPPEVVGFIVIQYPIVNSTRPVLSRKFWEEGAARIVLNVRRTVGIDQGLEWADDLATLYRATKFDGVQTFQPSAPIIDDDLEDGNWLSFSVIVPYRFQFDDAGNGGGNGGNGGTMIIENVVDDLGVLVADTDGVQVVAEVVS